MKSGVIAHDLVLAAGVLEWLFHTHSHRDQAMTESRHTESGQTPGRDDPHAQRLRNEARKTKETIKEEARRTGESVRREARSTADRGKRRAADELQGVSRAAERSAEAFRDEGRPELGDAMGSLADGMERFATRLRNKDLDQILHEARDAARDNPLLFYGAAATAGFLSARLMTAQRRPRQSADSEPATTTPVGSEPYRTAGYTPMGARSTDGNEPVPGAVGRTTRTDTGPAPLDEENRRVDAGSTNPRASAGSDAGKSTSNRGGKQ